MLRRFFAICLAAFLGCALSLPARPAHAEQIVLQLKYLHQFQFAGYYAALKEGYYADEGLDVTLREGVPGQNPLAALLDGSADYAVHNAQAMLDYQRGTPLVALAAIFQHSPAVLLVRSDSGTSSPSDLKGKRIMVYMEQDAEIRAMLQSAGVTTANTEFIHHTWDVTPLYTKQVAALSGYTTNETFALREMGVPVTELAPMTYGIDFYGDCLYTTKDTATTHTDRTQRFVRASLRGWDYAMSHPEDIARHIAQTYAPHTTTQTLLREAEALRSLMMPKLVPVGTMNAARWEHIATTFANLGFIDSVRPIDAFLFHPNGVLPSSIKQLLWALGVAILLTGGGLFALFSFNARLKRAVERRTNELEEHRQTMETILSVSPSGLLLGKGRIIEWASPALGRLLGYEEDELAGMDTHDIYATNREYRRVGAHLIQSLDRSGSASLDAAMRRKDGTHVSVFMSLRHLDFTDPNRGYIAALMDITERKRSEDSIRLAAQVFEQSSDSIIITDSDNRIVEVNRTFTELTGYTPEEVLGHRPNTLKSGRHDRDFYAKMWESISFDGKWSGEIWNRKKDGELFPAWLRITTLKDASGEVVNFIGTFSDLTREKKSAESIYRLNNFDVLTELPNRALFMNLLAQELSHAQNNESGVGVILFDLDNFKNVNESMGIASGDEVLQQTSKRIKAAFTDGLTAARLGSDEFAMMIPGVADSESLTQIIPRLQQAIAPAFALPGGEAFLTCTMGIAIFPDDATDAEELMKNAENALHHAREVGFNTYAFFSTEMTERASERLQLETALRHAIERGEFELYYQPKVDIDSGHVTGAEALIRWNHPDWGLVSPIRFIPILEKGDLIVPVGEWVLREACAACSRLHAAGHEDLRIAVNLSPRQFLESNIVAMVERCLKEHSLAPRFIELEITEALLVQDVVRVSETLKSLKRLGVTIAVDDFGTGYSSLSYLTEFTLDTLKIDQAFIRNVENDKKSAAITSTIQAMAKSMELTVVAEGVENEAQLDFLRSLGCVTAQGYYYAKPLPEAAFRDWLRAQPAPQGSAPHCGP
ncbi:hypothetical protein JCM16814_07290 [Desulfobaculum senezii]